VEMDEAQRNAQPLPEGPGPLAGAPGGQLLEQVVDGLATGRGTTLDAFIQWHIDNLCQV